MTPEPTGPAVRRELCNRILVASPSITHPSTRLAPTCGANYPAPSRQPKRTLTPTPCCWLARI